MNLQTAENVFISLVDSLEHEERCQFLSWCKNRYFSETSYSNAFLKLRQIAEEIKTLVPTEAILSSEKIDHSQFGAYTAGEEDKVLHVDSFLFEEEDIDALVEEGKLSRNYCRQCKSTDIHPITFISHSSSIHSLEHIFGNILPDLNNKTVLDVGSRLGAVLYGAYFCSAAEKIIGVEINKDLCEIQNYVIQKYDLRHRIEVICDNVCNVPFIVKSANVIILNNVFECFSSKQSQEEIWRWLRKNITNSGTIIISVPSIEESLSLLKTGIDTSLWLRKLPTKEPESIRLEDDDIISNICSYVVL